MTRPTIHGRKITFAIEKLAERSGGAERVLIEVANAFAGRGYQVEILSHELRGRAPFYPLHFGVSHTNLRGLPNARSRLRRLLDRFRQKFHPKDGIPFPFDRLVWRSRHDGFFRRMQRHVDLTKPDVVVAFMPPAITALARINGKHTPYKFASMHNAPEQDFENPLRWDPSDYDRKRRLELMSKMDCIGILLPEYTDWYQEPLRSKTRVIPNFVVPVAKSKLALAKREKNILCVGRLASVKRHDLSLKVFASLAEEFPDWTLEVLGTGPQSETLQASIKELSLEKRAYLRGHTKQISVKYLNSSILCHPAEFEGFPLAVTEALASALPVVGFSDCSGLNRLVKDKLNGVLVDPRSGSDEDRFTGLRAALQQMMRNQEYRENLGSNGPSSMAEYVPETVVDLWEHACFGSSVEG